MYTNEDILSWKIVFFIDEGMVIYDYHTVSLKGVEVGYQIAIYQVA